MKNLKSLVTTALLIASPLSAFAANDAKISINCVNLNDSGGNIVYAVYASEDSFNQRKGEVATLTVPVAAGDIDTAEFAHLKAGTYTVTAFHDSNKDGELNTGFMGRPKEQFAISNITRKLWSAPRWQETSFDVKEGETKSISLLFKMQ